MPFWILVKSFDNPKWPENFQSESGEWNFETYVQRGPGHTNKIHNKNNKMQQKYFSQINSWYCQRSNSKNLANLKTLRITPCSTTLQP